MTRLVNAKDYRFERGAAKGSLGAYPRRIAMLVADVMTRKVVSVDREDPLSEVLNKLRAYRISCVVVCEEDHPLGLISERDIVGVAFNYVSGKGEDRTLAGELMSSSLTTLKTGDSLQHAIQVVERERIRHLPVVDHDGRLVGLVTQTDLLRASLTQLADARSSR